MTLAGSDLGFLRPPDWPHPADFAVPPTKADHERWAEADRVARPKRLARLRERMVAHGVDGYFGLRWEHMRYLTGLPFDESEVTGPFQSRLLNELTSSNEEPVEGAADVLLDEFSLPSRNQPGARDADNGR